MNKREPRLTDKIVQHIKTLIQEQGLEAGMRLPAERYLANQLACSRSILREAIQKLVGEGVLVSRGGGGTYLCYDPPPWSEQHLVQPLKILVEEDPSYQLDIIEARHTIEASTAWYAALRATPEDKDKLINCFDATLKFKDSDDPALAAQADVRFHLAIAEASHNLILLQTMRGFFDLLQSSVLHSRQHMYTTPAIFAQLTEQHHELLQAILSADPERAKHAAQLHLSFVHSTHRTQQEDRARQSRLTRLPDDNNAVTRENKS